MRTLDVVKKGARRKQEEGLKSNLEPGSMQKVERARDGQASLYGEKGKKQEASSIIHKGKPRLELVINMEQH